MLRRRKNLRRELSREQVEPWRAIKGSLQNEKDQIIKSKILKVIEKKLPRTNLCRIKIIRKSKKRRRRCSTARMRKLLSKFKERFQS